MKKFVFLLLLIPVLAFPQKSYRGSGGITLGKMLSIISDSTVWHKKGSTPDTILVDGGLPIRVTGLKVTGTTTLDGTLSMNTVPTEQVKLGTGSNAAPELSSMADPNTGIRFPGSDTTVFVQGGTRKVTIAPTGKLTVNDSLVTLTGSRNEGGARIKGASTFGATGTTATIASTGAISNSIGGSTIGLSIDGNKTTGNLAQFINDNNGAVGDSSVVIGTDGRIGVKKASSSYSIDVLGDVNVTTYYRLNGNAIIAADLFQQTGAAGVTLKATNASGPIIFTPGNSEAARFLNTGLFGIGTTVPIAMLHVNNNNVWSKPLFRLGRDRLGSAVVDSLAGGVTGSGKWFMSTNPADTSAQVTISGRKTAAVTNIFSAGNDYDGSVGDSTSYVQLDGKTVTPGLIITNGTQQWKLSLGTSKQLEFYYKNTNSWIKKASVDTTGAFTDEY